MCEEPMLREGDRVYAVCDGPVGNKSISMGDTGTIVVVLEAGYGVRWDHAVTSGNSLNGRCDMGYGWYVFKNEIGLVIQDETDEAEPATDEELMCFLYDKEA